tara:strand:+ start:142 stop:603 length:462 start_codon:yes stop_codon:yes gene_type:complete
MVYEPFRFPAKGCFPLAILVFVFLIALLLDTCVSKEVVARATSPDGKVVARLYEINGGATTDFRYSVQLSRKWPRWDHEAASLYGAVRSNCAYGLNMRWRDDRTLELEYLEAKKTTFDRSLSVAGKEISIVLRAGVNDERAACGGMLYNLQGG